MSDSIKQKIEQIIINEIAALNRPDLFRKPLISYSSGHDKRYFDLKKVIGDWHLNPVELLQDVNSIISYFVPFTKTVVSAPKNEENGASLWGEAYEIVNSYFNHINEVLSEYLASLGLSSKAIPATHTYDPKDMKATWSHKSAAAIAGLGTFGSNRLIITDKGSGGRFGTLLTSANLEANKEPVPDRCLNLKGGSCDLCYKICPVNAFLDDDIDRFACQEELFKNGEKLRERTHLVKADVCGKCISICPVAYIE
ncbi:MAG: hypothetical protein FWE29_04555 [Defluviitaleaceae bacterium]|nr:hypothetical protein [Defluviitaleaceae bacterium]